MKCHSDMIVKVKIDSSDSMFFGSCYRKDWWKMGNFILFLNSFLSYLLQLVVIAVLSGATMFVGIKMRKRKNEQLKSERTDA